MMFKNVSLNKVSPITKKNYNQLDGIYSNLPFHTALISYKHFAGPKYFPTPLWENTYGFLNNRRKGDTTAKTVKVDFIRKNRIRLVLYKNNKDEIERIIKGHIRNGYCKQRFIVYPFIPLFFGYNSHRFRIGKMYDNLVIDFKWSYWGFAIVGGGDGKGQSRTSYKKI